jgi:hypothetical protein
MRKWLTDLDRVLRGESTRLSALRGDTIDVPASGLCGVVLALALLYGLCMGSYAVFRPGGPVFLQLLASTVKMPALFFLTLLVTFPSLYVSNALLGSRLTFVALFRLLIASLAVNVAVLASLGPIVAFFSLTTTSYAFVVLMNVVACGVSGGLGVAFLLQTLHRLSLVAHAEPPPPRPTPVPAQNVPLEGATASPPPEPPFAESRLSAPPVEARLVEEPGVLERPDARVVSRRVKIVVNCWVVVFALVGAQMGWVLRPFIGAPNTPFEWLRTRGSNFFQAVWETVLSLFS